MRYYHKEASSALTRYGSASSISKVSPKDYATILEWYERRGKQAPEIASFSDLGYIVDGRVAGWLYLTNSNMAMIEGIISDPNTVPSLRKESLKKLVGFLIDCAMALGYTQIFGLSKHPAILDISRQFGFKEAEGFKLVTLSTDDE